MACRPIHLEYHVAAIALNNMGVSLLEKRRCRAAMDAFQNSVTIIKTVLLLTAQESDEQSQLQLEEQATSSWSTVQDLVRRSSQALFCPPRKQTPHAADTNAHPSAVMNLRVISLEDSAVAVQQILKKSETKKEAITTPRRGPIDDQERILIRIDDSSPCWPAPMGAGEANENFHVETSIILYNFGMSFRYLASANADDGLLSRALSISEISYSIFQDNFWTLESIQESGIWVEYLPLSILFLQHLAMLASQTGKSTTAQVTQLKLTEASELFLDQQVQFLGGFQRATAGAA